MSVDQLAPAPAVARAPRPTAPDGHCGIELGVDASIGLRHYDRIGLDTVDYAGRSLVGPELDSGADAPPSTASSGQPVEMLNSSSRVRKSAHCGVRGPS